MKTKSYETIAEFLRSENSAQNRLRIRFMIHVSGLFESFLTSLQSESPMIHQLYEKMKNLMTSLLVLVLPSDKIPRDGRKLAEVKVNELDPSLALNIPPSLQSDFNQLDSSAKRRLKKELRNSVIGMIDYLRDHLPLKNEIIRKAKYLNPTERENMNAKEHIVALGEMTGRFTPSELDKIAGQWTWYAMKPFEAIPFSRIENYWNGILKQFSRFDLEEPIELGRLVRIILTLSHGQSDIERNFSHTKRLIHSRELMSAQSLKSQKLVRNFVNRCGGSDQVPVTSGMISCMRNARSEYRQDLLKQEQEKKKAMQEKGKSEEIAEKRKAAEEEKMAKERKIKKLKMEIDAVEKSLEFQKSVRGNAISQGRSTQDASIVKVNLATIEASTIEIEELTKKLLSKSKELSKLN